MDFKNNFYRKLCVTVCLVVIIGMFSACGQEQGVSLEQETEITSQETTVSEQLQSQPEDETESVPEQTEEANLPQESRQTQESSQIRDGSIAEQTFEVELSEYDGKVIFVPYMPDDEYPMLHMEIVQDGEVLTTIKGYVPEALEEEEFTSLDAVSFYDVNYDSYTDIVLVQTYGESAFVSIYEGFPKDAGEYNNRFWVRGYLSDRLTDELNRQGEVSVSRLRDFLADGKKNGNFSSYQEAYEMVSRLEEAEYDQSDLEYGLIYFDEDDIPELAVGKNGYYVSLYTYREGRIQLLMDHWAYGAMGNAGYEYAPGKNSLRNYNTDHAGAVLYTTYMAINEDGFLERVAEIVTYNFDDVNQNGMPDENEMASMGLYGVTYVNGVEETANESAVYDVGEYEYILGNMSLEELKERL